MRRPSLIEWEAFRAAMANGGPAAAARRLGRAQSSVSRAIGALEEKLGFTLFRRQGRRLVATAEARALDQELDQVFAGLDRLAGRSAELALGAARRLAIGAPAPFALSLLPAAMAAFQAGDPDCVVELQVAPSDELALALAERRLDLAVTDTLALAHRGRLVPFRRSRIACILPPGHPLAQREQLMEADFAGQAFIALTKRHPMRAQLDEAFRLAGIERRMVAEASTALAAIACVRQGLGVTLLNPFPYLTLPAAPADLALRRFALRLEYRSAFLLPDEGVPPLAVRRMMAAIRRSCGAGDLWSEPLRSD